LLFIDTPESTTQVEPFGKEASNFTCTALKKAKKIILETDGKDVYDKYDRLLAWVWLDGKLHQENITKAGLVEGYYDYGNYKYEQKVRSAMSFAQKNKLGIYKK
jgi:micrococcal nuclease